MKMIFKIMNEAILHDLKEYTNKNMCFYENGDQDLFLSVLEYYPDNTYIDLNVSDSSNRSKEDLSNAIKLFEFYKDLPLSLASDEKFWAYLTHTNHWNYMIRRWPVSEAEGNKEEFIKTRYFFNTRSKTFYRNGLSRLWWFVYLTYDYENNDPYIYTRMILSNQDLANLLIETTSISRNKVILRSILEVINKISELENLKKIDRIRNKRTLLRDLAKFTNLVGGVTVWDKLSDKEAYDIAWSFVETKISYVENFESLSS